MQRVKPSKADLAAAYAEVDPQWPAIVRTNERMLKILMRLSPMAQKQAVCMLAATWILPHRSAGDEKGFGLAEAFCEQIKLYLVADEGGMN